MNPFYKLNQTLNSIGNEQEKIAKEVAKAAEKSPVRKSLEESLRSDMKALMEGQTQKDFDKLYAKAMSTPDGRKKIAKAEKSKDPHSINKAVGFKQSVKEDGTGGMSQSNTLESQINEYFIEPGGDVTEMLNLNLFDALLGDTALVNHYPEFKQSPEWMAVVKKWKPVAIQLANEIRANKGTQLSDEQCDALDDTVYDGSDAYDDPRDAASYFPGTFQEQADLISEILGNLSESGAGGIHGSYPDPMTKKDQQKKMNPPRSLEEESEEDIMDYLNRKLAPHDKQQAKEDAVARSYNKGTGKPDAHNGMEFEGNAFTGKLKSTPKGGKFKVDGEQYTDTSELDEAVSRKHFQAIADTLKHIEDMDKRRELAQHHASAFKLANPRFDQARFFQAAGLEEGIVGATLGGLAGAAVGGPVGAVRGAMAGNSIGNAISPDQPEVDEGFDDMDKWLAQREKEKGTGKFDKRKVSTGTVYTRKFSDEPADDDTDAPASKGGAPRGRGRPAGTKRAIGAKHSGRSKLASKDAIAEQGCKVCEMCGQDIQEKSVSQAQAHMMAGVAHNPKFAKKVGIKQSVGKEFNKADKGKDISKLPKKVKKTEEGAKPDFLDMDKDGDKKEPMKKAVADKKEKKVAETTTAGSVATTAAPKAKSNSMGIGQGIYDSWNREIESMISESVQVKKKVVEHAEDGDEEAITITATGADVHRIRELLAAMGIEHETSGEECDTMADEGVVGQVAGTIAGNMIAPGIGGAIGGAIGNNVTGDGIVEADAPVDENSPDYPTNQEESDDALQYSGGLDGKKSTGQSTVPVLASQKERQVSEASSFMNLYKAFSKIVK